MKTGVDSFAIPLSWYAAVPLLAVVPVLLLMISLDEQAYRSWLPLAALIKAAGIPALAVFIARTVPAALRFGLSDDAALVKSILTAFVFILGDTLIGVYCFGRNRILCK